MERDATTAWSQTSPLKSAFTDRKVLPKQKDSKARDRDPRQSRRRVWGWEQRFFPRPPPDACKGQDVKSSEEGSGVVEKN